MFHIGHNFMKAPKRSIRVLGSINRHMLTYSMLNDDVLLIVVKKNIGFKLSFLQSVLFAVATKAIPIVSR